MKTSTRRIIILMLATALTAAFGAGCSTVRGVGKDVGKVGDHIEDSTH